ncbi:sugar ABC transporter ATP-binding protein [Pseudomonas oryzihabitans]|nr:sugar ABC transporter ATP-binding protein [Pseudomonas psychrotolerans]KTT65411.1 sugar ABC transporter ATP-binding protein [Pseudomonas psychrotolerans]
MSLLKAVNIGKSYKTYRSEWHRIAGWFGRRVSPKEEKWVLRNINFELQAGEAVGIVGQNGAGKSTLLKIITGTLAPTEGQLQCRGRISAILELGMGFNGELTGRQNAVHTAGLMGFSQAQIATIIDEIAEFAEIGDYFDKPVRMYSSGMQMRVAFAVATAYRPEILIVDEALSVGDAYFQHKSFNRIKEFQQQGTTLLIVSHDRSSIQALCDRALLLDGGSIVREGNPEEILDYYNALIADKENSKIETRTLPSGQVQTISGTGEVKISDITLNNEKGEAVEIVSVGQRVSLKIKCRAYQDIPELVCGYMIKDRLGQTIYGTNTYHQKQIIRNVKADNSVEFEIAFTAALGPGSYSFCIALHSADSHLINNYEWRDLALVFSVVNTGQPEFIGMAWLPSTITCRV